MEATPESIHETEIALRLAFEEATKRLDATTVKPKELSSYGRQYFGGMKEGRRIIEAIEFCDGHGLNSLDLSKTPLRVLDGGMRYFSGNSYMGRKAFECFLFSRGGMTHRPTPCA